MTLTLAFSQCNFSNNLLSLPSFLLGSGKLCENVIEEEVEELL